LTGRIADTLVGDFAFVPHAELIAVASRSAPRAQTFATKHGIQHAFGNYIELIESPEVDVLYIATPHPQHLQIGLAAVRAGKAILVERAFTATLAGAIELVEEARTQKVFAMEAMWTRFQPAIVRARELIASGAIGSVRSVKADLGVVRDYDPADPRSAYELGSGALLDLDVYLASFAQMVLGAPTRVTSNGSLEPSGVDAEASLLVEFEGPNDEPRNSSDRVDPRPFHATSRTPSTTHRCRSAPWPTRRLKIRRGRFIKPVSFETRIRSSHRARRRWR
jgi:predicted dehydrogenase